MAPAMARMMCSLLLLSISSVRSMAPDRTLEVDEANEAVSLLQTQAWRASQVRSGASTPGAFWGAMCGEVQDAKQCRLYGDPHISHTFSFSPAADTLHPNKWRSHLLTTTKGATLLAKHADDSFEMQYFGCNHMSLTGVALRFDQTVVEFYVELNTNALGKYEWPWREAEAQDGSIRPKQKVMVRGRPAKFGVEYPDGFIITENGWEKDFGPKFCISSPKHGVSVNVRGMDSQYFMVELFVERSRETQGSGTLCGTPLGELDSGVGAYNLKGFREGSFSVSGDDSLFNHQVQTQLCSFCGLTPAECRHPPPPEEPISATQACEQTGTKYEKAERACQDLENFPAFFDDCLLDYCMNPSPAAVIAVKDAEADEFPADDTAAAVDDPHLTNAAGQKFDVPTAGTHQLLIIPEDASTEDAELYVNAEVQHEGQRAEDLWIRRLHVGGTWVGRPLKFKTGAGGFGEPDNTLVRRGNGSWTSPEKLALQLPSLKVKKEAEDELPPGKDFQQSIAKKVELSAGPLVLHIKWGSAQKNGEDHNHIDFHVDGLSLVRDRIGGLLKGTA